VSAEDGHLYALDLIDGLTPVPILSEEWVLDTCDVREQLASVGLTLPTATKATCSSWPSSRASATLLNGSP